MREKQFLSLKLNNQMEFIDHIAYLVELEVLKYLLCCPY